MRAGRAHHVAGHAVVAEVETRLRRAIDQIRRAEAIEGGTAQAVFGGLDFRHCAAKRVAGGEDVFLGDALPGRLGDHLRGERIGRGSLRVDGIAHHFGIDGDVLQRGERVVGLFGLGCAGK
ncbi:hypothetical protein ATB54_11780 [Xanthomonas translucens]|nr:hypothetical protein ATB54_11780 [Xanthomonas translucens]